MQARLHSNVVAGSLWFVFAIPLLPVNVAWRKNCREESDKVFAIGYQVG